MAKTLLNGVNEVLKRSNLIQGDSGALTTLSDSPKQVWVDTAVQAWNEAVERLYEASDKPMPNELVEATIDLVASTRAYALAGNYNTLYWPFTNETTGHQIFEWTAGYLNLVNGQIVPANYTGQPNYGTIRPTDGQVYLDRIPSSSENGDTYKYRYDQDVSMSAAADTVPFKDSVFRALVPAVTEIFNITHKREFNEGAFADGMGRASRLLTGKPLRTSYSRKFRQVDNGIFAPFNG